MYECASRSVAIAYILKVWRWSGRMLVKIMIDLNPIHDKLMRRVYPEHQLPPKIRMLRDRLDIKCCCESFRKEV